MQKVEANNGKETPYEARRETIQFPSSTDGVRLNATVFFPKRARTRRPAILFVPGKDPPEEPSAEDVENLARRVTEETGTVTMVFYPRGARKNFRFEGQDANTTTPRQILDDPGKAYDALSSLEKVDEGRIGLCGRSLGGWLAALATGKREFESVLLVIPTVHEDDAMDLPYRGSEAGSRQQISEIEKNTTATKVLERYVQRGGKVSILYGNNDEKATWNVIKKYAEAVGRILNFRIHRMQDADHGIKEPENVEQITNVAINWFRNSLCKK